MFILISVTQYQGHTDAEALSQSQDEQTHVAALDPPSEVLVDALLCHDAEGTAHEEADAQVYQHGHANHNPAPCAGLIVLEEMIRAEATRDKHDDHQPVPFVVGAHWLEWVDQEQVQVVEDNVGACMKQEEANREPGPLDQVAVSMIPKVEFVYFHAVFIFSQEWAYQHPIRAYGLKP